MQDRTFTIIMVLSLAASILLFTGHTKVEDCKEKINECYYTYHCGKTTCTTYVSCLDTKASSVHQVCLKDAHEEALKDLYYMRNTTLK